MQTHNVVLKKTAQKDLKKVDKRYKARVYEALRLLAYEPYWGKSLMGDLAGFYSLRIGLYRIIYKIFKNELVVFVIAIEHRQGVYK